MSEMLWSRQIVAVRAEYSLEVNPSNFLLPVIGNMDDMVEALENAVTWLDDPEEKKGALRTKEFLVRAQEYQAELVGHHEDKDCKDKSWLRFTLEFPDEGVLARFEEFLDQQIQNVSE